jgi:DDE superfamily endonuclease
MYMSSNFVGSTLDCLSFACSRLGRALQSKASLGIYWIAGDAASDCGSGLVVPWSKGQLLDEKDGLFRDSFNYFHSSLRIHVEQAFGMLVSRFGVLWKPIRFDITRVAQIVSSCMRLHNYCIDYGIPAARAAAHEDRTVSNAAYCRWWKATTEQRDDVGGTHGQGRRTDLRTVTHGMIFIAR